MGIRQKEKSEMTRKELSDSMIRLFLEKGYEETSIQDIAEAAGYSVGSFYRHWKSKQEAFMEFWDIHVSDFIRCSIENVPKDCTQKEMIDYLIRRSEEYSRNEITVKLYVSSRVLSAMYKYEGLTDWANRFTQMIYDFVKQSTGCRDECKLMTTANIIHAILDTHAMQYSTVVAPHYNIDSSVLRDCLMDILAGLQNTYGMVQNNQESGNLLH